MVVSITALMTSGKESITIKLVNQNEKTSGFDNPVIETQMIFPPPIFASIPKTIKSTIPYMRVDAISPLISSPFY